MTEDEEVIRENYLDTIEQMWTPLGDVILIKGAVGIGKSTLLRQFASRHPDRTVSLHIRPVSKLAYELQSLVLQLYEQIAILAELRNIPPSEDITIAHLRQAIRALQGRSRRRQIEYYFIIDGLDDIPIEENDRKKQILDELPFGVSGFKFLLSGNDLPLHENVRARDLPLVAFTSDETFRYLCDVVPDRKQCDEISKTCRGVPGHLASVRRVLRGGTHIDALLSNFPSSVPELFELEWKRIEPSLDILKVLTILAFDRNEHSIEALARIIDISEVELLEALSKITFITLTTRTPSYISVPFREFACRKLERQRRDTTELLLADRLKQPTSNEALFSTPDYLEQLGRYDQLIMYLSPAHFAMLLERENSFSQIEEKASSGMRAANRLGREGDLIRFSLQLATVRAIASESGWKSEVEARAVLNDIPGAKMIAQSALLKETRLQLFATIARTSRQNNIAVDHDIITEIEKLYTEVDITAMGNRAVAIATDLLYVNPEMAISLIERSTKAGSANKQERDWALAKMSATAAQSQPTASFQETSAAIREHLTDPAAQRLARAAAALYAAYDTKDILAEARAISEESARIEVLRFWLIGNATRPDAAEVAEYALRELIAARGVETSARILYELASPIAFITEDSRKRYLVGMFDAHRITAETVGQTVEYVRFCLRLARAQYSYDSDSAYQRYEEMYLYVSYLPDVLLKTTCSAHLIAALRSIRADVGVPQYSELYTLLITQFDALLEQILLRSAEHMLTMKDIIVALSTHCREKAIALAGKLNTQERRDDALAAFINASAWAGADEDGLNDALAATRGISDTSERDTALIRISEASFSRARSSPLSDRYMNLLPSYYTAICSSEARCRVLSLYYSYLCEIKSSKQAQVCEELYQSWSLIESGWSKVESGFRVAMEIARTDDATSRRFLLDSDAYRREIGVSSDTTSNTILQCMRLVVRGLSGLLPNKLENVGDIERIGKIIEHIPSVINRLAIWGDVAFRYRIADRTDECKKIVTRSILPALNAIEPRGGFEYERAASMIMPCLYSAHPTDAKERLEKMSLSSRNYGCNLIFRGLLRKHDPMDTYDPDRQPSVELRYEDALELIQVVSWMSRDDTIATAISDIVTSLLSSRNRGFTTKTQKHELAGRLKAIVDSKLPDMANIKHDGYKLLCMASIAKLDSAKPSEWIDLISKARGIPNVSDRAFVLADFARRVPSSEGALRRELFDESMRLTSDVIGSSEQCGRYRWICEIALEVGQRDTAKAASRSAMLSATSCPEDEILAYKRKVLAQAYQIDPEFARSLANETSHGTATAANTAVMRTQLAKLERADDRRNSNSSITVEGAWHEEIGEQAWSLLASLNAGRLAVLPRERVRQWIETASMTELGGSFPAFSLAIESLSKKYARTPEANITMRAVFDGLVLAQELTMRVGMRSTNGFPKVGNHTEYAANSLIVRHGERDKALTFIERWLQESSGDVLKICDAFFSVEDLEILRIVRNVRPECTVKILTSTQGQSRVPQPWDDEYRAYWYRLSDQDPPETDIVVAGFVNDGTFPIHDRWWFIGDCGLRSGTSFNGLGARESELSLMTQQESTTRMEEVDRFMERRVREQGGRRISYQLFTL